MLKFIRQSNHNRIRIYTHFTPEEVFALSCVKSLPFFSDVNVQTNTRSLKVFRKSLRCAFCKIEGTRFYLEKYPLTSFTCGDPNNAPWLFFLYALGPKGNEILMTKDHILKAALGGSSELKNLRTMCVQCNSSRDKIEIESLKVKYASRHV